ncbi:MAG TPA: dihydrodipicolinate synthase family protein [Geminicoccaceae bacterium]
MARGRFRGVYPMLYAFFDDGGRLDRGAMRAQIDYCVAGGAHGIACLGLGTEVKKLTPDERRAVVAWAAEDLGGRLPLAVTVYGATPEEQSAFVRDAAALGTDWVILQPPQTGERWTEAGLVRFFGAVADRSPVPVAIQNAPQYIGVGLSDAGLDTLSRNHPNVSLLKAEGSAVETAMLIEATQGRMEVFQGRGGLEFPDVIRAGCVGMIPSVESVHLQSRLFELLITGDPRDQLEGERLYARLAPLMVFLMQSVDSFLCYGKRLTARRIGIEAVHDRAPALAPTAFGLACLEHHARVLEARDPAPA